MSRSQTGPGITSGAKIGEVEGGHRWVYPCRVVSFRDPGTADVLSVSRRPSYDTDVPMTTRVVLSVVDFSDRE